jgi:hypothetical protein
MRAPWLRACKVVMTMWALTLGACGPLHRAPIQHTDVVGGVPSLELYAFLETLPDVARWQAAVDQIGIGLKLDPTMDLATDGGFSPCKLKGRETGFEILVEPAADVLRGYPALASVVGSRSQVISFRWGSEFAECASAMGASLALLRSFGAIVYYPSDNIIYRDPSQLRRDLDGCLSEL